MLKANQHTAHIPVVIVSALNNEDSKIMALKKGAVDYITKPFSTRAFKDRISAHIEKVKAES
jgi:DNA-binding response OmpR family regulator